MTYIYFAQCGDNIKIGMAANVAARMSSLRVGSAAPLNLIGCIAGGLHDEKKLHDRLSDFRTQGEWFQDCPEVRAVIEVAISAGEVGKLKPLKADRGKTKFGQVAKVIWPSKTAEHIAAIAGVDARTATRWIGGEIEPPAIVIAAVIVEITKRS